MAELTFVEGCSLVILGIAINHIFTFIGIYFDTVHFFLNQIKPALTSVGAGFKQKREALEKAYVDVIPVNSQNARWERDSNLKVWLKNFGK